MNRSIVLNGAQTLLNEIDQSGHGIGITELRVLVYVMRTRKATGIEISNDLGLSKATVSRAIALLSTDKPTRKQAPLEFVSVEADASDPLIKRAAITEKGEAFVTRMVTSDAPSADTLY